MSDVAAFVRARLDEDEAAAEAATGAEWHWTDPGLPKAKSALVDDAGQYVVLAAHADSYPSTTDADHIARHDPARVLAQVAAMRAIVDLAEDATGLDALVDDERRIGPRDFASEPYVGDKMLRHLAAIWRDHPDYDPAWTVE